ncbi:MAG: chromosomal replication initiator protein DnaA [Erysipelotrichales bacterium]
MSEKLDTLWLKCLDLIKDEINDELIFENFFATSSLVDIKDNVAHILLDSIFSAKYFEDSQELVESCLAKISETNFKTKFIMKDEYMQELEEENIEDNLFSFSDTLRSDYTFENFVIGDSNQESYQAAITVSNKPGTLFNPLFIYGKSGLGKTHIVHSIGNRIKELKPNMRVLYVTSETFLNDYINRTVKSKDKKDYDWFNDKYRDIDVLIVDDIQFLAGKEKCNEMFFNVYNDLFNKNKQIIITSDVMPKELFGLEERLVSRFTQGLSVSISPPEYETSLKILKKKLSYFNGSEDTIINDDALAYIAKNFSKDVRDLEGAMQRVIFYTINFSDNNEITMDIVYEAFKDHNFKKIDGDISEEKILKTVCNYYNLSKTQITSKSRQKLITVPRQIAIYLTRTLLETPYEKIGKIYGNRDHSTIMSSYHKVNEQVNKKNQEYIAVIDELNKLLKS